MTTINTSDELVVLVREDPVFRAAMRRELLTAELLETPQRLAALERSVAELVEHTNRTNERLDKMDQTIAAIVEQTNALNKRLDAVESDIAVMKGDIAETKSDIVVMKADIAETKSDITVMKADIAETKSDIVVMKADIAETKSDIVVMKSDIAETKSDITVMKGDISDIKNDINGLGATFRREVRAQSSYRGNYAQRATVMSNQDIASRFAHLHGLHRVTTRQVRRATSEAWLANNIPLVESIGLRERAWNTFLVPDDIAGVVPLGASDDTVPSFYIVVESSYTVEKEDILKATDHAQIVQVVTGIDAYAVVAGAEVDDEMDEEARRRLYVDVERFVEAKDPGAAYLYLLDSADMRPPEPF